MRVGKTPGSIWLAAVDGNRCPVAAQSGRLPPFNPSGLTSDKKWARCNHHVLSRRQAAGVKRKNNVQEIILIYELDDDCSPARDAGARPGAGTAEAGSDHISSGPEGRRFRSLRIGFGGPAAIRGR